MAHDLTMSELLTKYIKNVLLTVEVHFLNDILVTTCIHVCICYKLKLIINVNIKY